ncbi:MAG: hypothetical protein IT324_28920 [Anaerolineae bacterium]|nr:hypothetical protein [Anaerolineae bacterium]
MTNFGGIIFLIIFGITTLMTYLAIRRNWARALVAGLIGFVINAVTLSFYSLSQYNPTVYALGVGIILGGVFTAMAVSIAVYFRANPPK